MTAALMAGPSPRPRRADEKALALETVGNVEEDGALGHGAGLMRLK